MKNLDIISNISLKTVWKIADLFGPGPALKIARTIQENPPVASVEELVGLIGEENATLLVEWANQEVENSQNRRKNRRLGTFQADGLMRSRYLPTSTLMYYRISPGERRWKFKRQIRGMGLMQAVVEHIHKKPMAPVAVPIQNVFEPQRGDEREDKDLPDEQINLLAKNDLLVSQERWAWNRNSPGWELLKLMFPNAVDATAYNHGLNAPTIPGGIWLEEQVRFRSIRQPNGELTGCDGSGRIHPRLLERLDKGVCPVQLRLITDQGTYAKGILIPDERCVRWELGDEDLQEDWLQVPDEADAVKAFKDRHPKYVAFRLDDEQKVEVAIPEVWVDWAQIKGSKKEVAAKFNKEGREYLTSAHVGIIQAWDKPGELDWCFEVLENIQNTEENWDTLKKNLELAFETLTEQGVDGLAARVAKDSPTAALAVRFITMLNAKGKNYSPLAIPWLRDAVEDRLQRILWQMAQGAGMSSPRYVACIDNQLAPGEVVLAGPGMKVGVEIACFRMPVVLAQVLNVCKIVEPLPHHLVGGKIVPYTIFMNQHDITSCLMGDDDGDVVGVSNDPKIVSMFKKKVDDRIYLIEPKGVKINKPLGSQEGIQYMARDQRGDVGRLTIMRSKLLAVGDIRGANAISILIQEAIDKAKRMVRWSDWRLATDLSNWVENQGKLSFQPKGSTPWYDANNKKVDVRLQAPVKNGHVDMNLVNDWVNERLIAAGVPFEEEVVGYTREGAPIVKKLPVPVLGWRLGGENKRIKPSNWADAAHYQVGNDRGVYWVGGNLVHRCFDYAMSLWKKIEDKFILNFQQVDLASLVHELLEAHGHKIPVTPMTWTEYERGLRKTSGVQELGQAFREAKMTKNDEDKYAKFDQALDDFQAKLAGASSKDLAQIWYMECKYSRLDNPENHGNINYAYYTIAWEGSPILELIGMEFRHTCDFLDRNKQVIPYVVKLCIEHPSPLERLREMVEANTTHGNEQKDESQQPIQCWECADCCERLQKAVVRKIRDIKTRKEHDFVKGLVHSLNHS